MTEILFLKDCLVGIVYVVRRTKMYNKYNYYGDQFE